MPWKEVSILSSRKEFVSLAWQEGAHVRALCRRFGISPKTGRKSCWPGSGVRAAPCRAPSAGAPGYIL